MLSQITHIKKISETIVQSEILREKMFMRVVRWKTDVGKAIRDNYQSYKPTLLQ